MEAVLGGHGLLAWGAFHALVFVLLAIDLGLFNRKSHVVGLREALVWNVVWTAVGLAFALVVFRSYGRQAGVEYVTGYVVERALSVDNIFVFVIIFRYFAVPAEHHRRVLYWGILGALVLRGALILTGAAVVAAFHWVLYLFGLFLVWTGIQLVVKGDDAPPHPERNLLVRIAGKLFPTTRELRGGRLFVREGGRLHATPLFVVLLVVESVDLVFALDSIPAIFGITRDPFIMYTSNVMAILGLRVMYFLLAAMLPRFRYLKAGLSVVLVFIGARMLAEPWIRLPEWLTLGLVVAILGVSIAASFLGKAGTAGGSDPGAGAA